MLGRMQSCLLIFFTVLCANFVYCQRDRYALPLPTNAELNGALSGLNLPGYGSAACSAAYPTATRLLCLPIDAQTVAYSLTGGDRTKLPTLRYANPALWKALPVLAAVLMVGFAAIGVSFSVLLLRHGLEYPFIAFRACRREDGKDYTVKPSGEDPVDGHNLPSGGTRRLTRLSLVLSLRDFDKSGIVTNAGKKTIDWNVIREL